MKKYNYFIPSHKIKIVTETFDNGNKIAYQVLENNHHYHAQTNSRIIAILEKAWYSGQKLKIYLGDTNTGKDWNEEHDTIGTIGFSTGRIKIPLLITSSRSHGGGGILDHCIVKIIDFKSKAVLYQHPLYVAPKVEIKETGKIDLPFATYVNDQVYGYHSSLRSAQICAAKIR